VSRAYFAFSETSPASASTAASSQPVQNAGSFLPAGVAGPMQSYDAVDVIAELKGATGGTLDVYLQISPNDGIDWFDLIHWPQLGAGASAVIYQAPISNATATTTTTVVGKNLSPTLGSATPTTGVVVNGAFSDRMRLVMVAGTSTSAGAAVVVRVSPQRAEES
jgi:hypothetical protein